MKISNGENLPADEKLQKIRQLISQLYPIKEIREEDNVIYFYLESTPSKESFLKLRDSLIPLDYLPVLRQREKETILTIIPKPPISETHAWINIILFLATLGTTFLAGYLNAVPLVEMGLLKSAFWSGLSFSFSLMAIIGAHEMGHKIMSRIRGVDATLPYFIPAPPPLTFGTFGAIIQTKTPAPNRDALFDLGVSGPLIGFMVLLPILVQGINSSFVVSVAPVGTINLGESLLFHLAIRLLLHPPAGTNVLIHPIAFAAWIGMLVTSLNLLPAGMLDGGHVARAVFGVRRHRWFSLGAIFLAIILGYWLMAVVIFLLSRRGHPGPLDDISPLSPNRKLVAVAILLVFILCIIPLPTFALF